MVLAKVYKVSVDLLLLAKETAIPLIEISKNYSDLQEYGSQFQHDGNNLSLFLYVLLF